MSQQVPSTIEPIPVTGTHILSELVLEDLSKLTDMKSFQDYLENTLTNLNVVILGGVYHQFPGGGYTSLVGLAESHISIHTWPDIKYLTLDIYLCDYTRDNKELTKKIHQQLISYFNPQKNNTRVIYR